VRFHDFDVWIDAKTPGGYPVRAACVPQGEARDVATLEAGADPLLALLGALGRGEAEPGDLVRLGRFLRRRFRSPTGDVEALLRNALLRRAARSRA
jgi:hypothetical protein